MLKADNAKRQRYNFIVGSDRCVSCSFLVHVIEKLYDDQWLVVFWSHSSLKTGQNIYLSKKSQIPKYTVCYI